MGEGMSEGARGESFENRSDFAGNRGDYYRGGYYRGGNEFNRGGANWDCGYSSYYGRGWDYRPGFGWGINIPLGRFGGIGLGNYYGYYGYPYYGWGDWNYWGPEGYYGSWGPGYGNYDYGYGYSSPAYYTQSNEQSSETAETGQNQGQMPPVPTSKELGRFTDQKLQSFIAWVANGFTRELGQYSSGDTWVKYFRLNDLKAMMPSAPGAAATAQPQLTSARGQRVIDAVLEHMDSTAKNDEYKTIADTWGFKALHAALQEATKPADEREPGVLKGQTEASASRLSTFRATPPRAGANIWRSASWKKSPTRKRSSPAMK